MEISNGVHAAGAERAADEKAAGAERAAGDGAAAGAERAADVVADGGTSSGAAVKPTSSASASRAELKEKAQDVATGTEPSELALIGQEMVLVERDAE